MRSLLSHKKYQTMEDGVSLSSLSNFAREGKYLKHSIAKWLDDEYITQTVHHRLGDKVEDVYIVNRSSGIDDLGEMLMEMGTALESFNMDEAFVNAWDVANKVSELLMIALTEPIGEHFVALEQSVNGEPCANVSSHHSNTNSDRIERAFKIRSIARKLSSEFARYKFLTAVLEGMLCAT